MYLGIDIGGTKVALRAELDDETVRESVFRWGGTADDVRELRRHVGVFLAGGPVPRGVGVALPATVDEAGRVTAWPNRPSWTGVRVRSLFASLLPMTRTRFGDDGDLAAVAEATAAGVRHAVYVGVGTGIGGGIVLDGRSCPGPGRGSCELGHIVVDRSGPVCGCGRRGCLQAVASGPAVLRSAGRRRGAAVTYEELVRGAAAGAGWACGALDDAAAALATALIGVAELVRPDRLLVGGGFAAGLPGFAGLIAGRVARLGRPGHPAPPVQPAALGGLSSLYGAVLAAKNLA
ncbi:ROK family protein [Actinoplanes sp. N902-109]|uniref:ROK family protein n=1 Tax=Actinoplanes sp. (strain N902-109) TaxID=649831 RepID=UPI0003296500|nr:ROK family protein [Actinoplanes sp. N902-109]AGL16411.1 glucose kinase [Actinoplanes sp. N902-109]